MASSPGRSVRLRNDADDRAGVRDQCRQRGNGKRTGAEIQDAHGNLPVKKPATTFRGRGGQSCRRSGIIGLRARDRRAFKDAERVFQRSWPLDDMAFRIRLVRSPAK